MSRTERLGSRSLPPSLQLTPFRVAAPVLFFAITGAPAAMIEPDSCSGIRRPDRFSGGTDLSILAATGCLVVGLKWLILGIVGSQRGSEAP